ncbi:DinB family protein [Aquimarina sp. ERC-38]|uniref:DinB family protein n=1 Tax=Aquimarina sp. ERC-38 TaxID=2949996 RepID=UPI002245D84B|nr:DinB family protein [Aquimarina sp. ERC-38]UZO79874.1 DinB family protein [Aquimarina sp. ERC-38]
MKKVIIAAVNQNLTKAIQLLDSITDKHYTDVSVGPYYSSIGSHIRHSLDFFNCVINGLDTNNIDLTKRTRDEALSKDRIAAKNHIYALQQTLVSYQSVSTNYLVHVTDDLGQGNVQVNYTLESILAHANSHALHHFAIIGYILHQLEVCIEIPGFGYNPTTPEQKRKGI